MGTRMTENAAADDVVATVLFRYLPYFGISGRQYFYPWRECVFGRYDKGIWLRKCSAGHRMWQYKEAEWV